MGIGFESLLLLFFSYSVSSVSADAAAGCNLYTGNWVINQSYPLYDSNTCPFVRPEFECIKYGRPDKLYQKYQWKPSGCELPRLVYILTHQVTMFHNLFHNFLILDVIYLLLLYEALMVWIY